MAKFRLKTAHQLRNTDNGGDAWLPGDKENETVGFERGTIVGDGTPYPVAHATLEMVALDDEAETMLRAEQERLEHKEAAMNPVDQLPLTLARLLGVNSDNYDDRYLPGFPGTPRPMKPPEPPPQGKGPTR